MHLKILREDSSLKVMLLFRGEMLPFVIRKHFISKSVRRLSILVSRQNDVSTKNQCLPTKSNLSHSALNFCINPCRRFTDEANLRLPKLLDEPVIKRLDFWKTLKNTFIYSVTIMTQIDNNFNAKEFEEGSKQAILVVSNALANQDYESLREMVVGDVINKLKKRIDILTPAQRKLIAVDPDLKPNIYFYDLNADASDSNNQLITITVVMNYLPCRHKLNSQQKVANVNAENDFFLNYRFMRKYNNGVGGPWVINMLNHFSV